MDERPQSNSQAFLFDSNLRLFRWPLGEIHVENVNAGDAVPKNRNSNETPSLFEFLDKLSLDKRPKNKQNRPRGTMHLPAGGSACTLIPPSRRG